MEIARHLVMLLWMFLYPQQDAVNILPEIKKMYEVTPNSADQLLKIKEYLHSHKQVKPWGGTLSTGMSSVLLASQADFDPFLKEVLQPLGVFHKVLFPHATGKTIQNQQPSSQLQTSRPILREKAPWEVKRIPGTSLYTGIWYRGAKKTPEGGVVTFLSKNMRLAVDAHPGRKYFYEEGGERYGTNVWSFRAAEDFPGWYELRNRVFPWGLVTWSSEECGSGQCLVIKDKPEDRTRLGVGGDLRDSALWQVIGDGDDVVLKNKHFPRGTITHCDDSLDNTDPTAHYLQVSLAPSHFARYQKGSYQYQHTLFSFTNSTDSIADNVELTAVISNFKFQNVSNDVVLAHKKSSVGQTFTLKFNNLPTSGGQSYRNIEHTFTHNSTLSYAFQGDFISFNKVSMKVEVPEVASYSLETGMQREVNKEGKLIESQTKTTEVELVAKVLKGNEVKYSPYSEWIENLSVPFEATMEVRGTTKDGKMLFGEEIIANLPPEWKQSKDLSKAGIGVKIPVKGNFVGTFGHIGVLTVASVYPMKP